MSDIINVLLVEDVKIARMVATNVLESLGFVVTIAETGSEALDLIAKNYYPMIFMDIGLPDNLDGFMVTEKIRSSENINKNTIIIALTAHDEESYVQQSIRSGMNNFLVKPLTADKVRSIIGMRDHTVEKIVR